MGGCCETEGRMLGGRSSLSRISLVNVNLIKNRKPILKINTEPQIIDLDKTKENSHLDINIHNHKHKYTKINEKLDEKFNEIWLKKNHSFKDIYKMNSEQIQKEVFT